MSADRNLLFGILALQMDFITRDQLISGMQAWALDKGKPLGEILSAQKALTSTNRALLEPLVGAHIAQHGNDPQRSLAAISSVSSLQQDLKQIADPEVAASLVHVVARSAADADPYRSMPLSIGAGQAQGNRFRILRPHARGGLGQVSVAADQELNREVALKEIQDRYADHPESRARFLLEAEITGGLEHPGIVPVYGLGAYLDGRPYYAMRFIKGDSLQEAITRFHAKDKTKRDPQERSLALRALLGRFVDVCQAGAYAHSRGVLHRDLKPGNVMLGKYGETLVVDWGLAKALSKAMAPSGNDSVALASVEVEGPAPTPAALATLITTSGQREAISEMSPETAARAEPFPERMLVPRSSTSNEMATQVGTAIGTPAYMSPEQAAGRLDLLGPASDVYSLGATLYHLLTGRPPFEGADLGLLLSHVQMGEFTPPRTAAQGVPAALDAICRKAMALKPADRYTDAQALAAEIERWLADEPVQAYREPLAIRARRWMARHRTLVTAAAASLVVAATGLAAGLALLAAANERERSARSRESVARQDAEGQRDRAEANFKLARDAVEKNLTGVADNPRLNQSDFYDLRKELLDAAIPFYAEFIKQKSDDPNLEASRGMAYSRLAHLRSETKDKEGATADYLEARKIFSRLVADFPEEPTYRQKLALSNVNLGILVNFTGKLKEAEQYQRDALAIRQTLATDFPKIPSYRLDLAGSYNQIGTLQRLSGRLKEAEQSFRLGLKITQALREEFPKVPRYRQDLAGMHQELAQVLEQTRRPKEAEEEFREADAIWKPLFAEYPKVPLYRQKLAEGRNNLGAILYRTGQLKDAEQAFREAVEILKLLVADFPTVQSYRQVLGNYRLQLAGMLRTSGHPKEAEQVYREALAIQQALAAELPRVPEYRNSVASSFLYLGDLLANSGRLKEGEQAYRDALAICQPLVAEAPDMVHYRRNLVDILTTLGQYFSEQGRLKEAAEMFRQASGLGDAKAAESMKRCERQIALVDRLPAILAGEAKLNNAAECVEFAELCILPQQSRYVAASRFFAEAFRQDPMLTADMKVGHRYNAACSGALASCGQGKDAEKLGAADKVKLRNQALDWLKADLAQWSKLAANGQGRAQSINRLRYWQQDSDLASVRGAAIDKLPESERAGWQALWRDVEAALPKPKKP